MLQVLSPYSKLLSNPSKLPFGTPSLKPLMEYAPALALISTFPGHTEADLLSEGYVFSVATARSLSLEFSVCVPLYILIAITDTGSPPLGSGFPAEPSRDTQLFFWLSWGVPGAEGEAFLMWSAFLSAGRLVCSDVSPGFGRGPKIPCYCKVT